MADTTTTTARAVWDSAYSKYLKLNEKLIAAPDGKRDELERAIAAQQEDLLDTEAPHLTALRQKLEFLWEGHLEGLDPETEYKRLILEDLENLTTQIVALAA